MSDSEQPKIGGIVSEFQAGTIADLAKSFDAIEYASFDPQTPEGAMLLITATLTDCPSIKSQVNKEITISNVYAHMAQGKPDEHGEVKPFQRTVIFNEKGKAFDGGSLGVAKSIGVISRIIGPPPWFPGVNCLVIVTDIDPPKQWITLLPNPESLKVHLLKSRPQKV